MSGKDLCNDPRCERNRKGEPHTDHDSQLREKNTRSIVDLIDAGTDIAGGTIGAAAGLALGGPPGAIMGAIAGAGISHTLKVIGNDFAQRLLGPREEVRVGAAISITAKRIEELIQNGVPVRQDDFFQDKPNERAAAKEIAEGVLLAAQREHEEKKIQYYATMLARIVFSPGIVRHMQICLSI